ncbi:hypothetical protein F5I97DRAFT_1805363 [Phlebopus sp. FC_14]|nr:hypothetical protein F5I97DRAFT_1805363 [Phlebopus sp. FC_14]
MSPSVVSASPAHIDDHPPVDDGPAKISAYYSLVFPNITFYLQTLTVTIGRRCIPAVSSSSSVNGAEGTTPGQSPVDVDLGPLKSVSRLHAKIEYEEEEERFVLVVIGRNGAWVDGVWSGSGSRVPLSERSQIQIASRTFHFVLPPPPAPEDSPSPSSNSSVPRARSPSVDITSISPPSSLPSHSPPPRSAPPLPPPKLAVKPEPQLPNSNAISRTSNKNGQHSPITTTIAPTSKKRKKPTQPLPRPEVMPPKPQLTYAQLCYRAIKGMGGKATLQDICGWMMENFDWYRYNEGAGWENSVRHNLSSGRAFKKMERSTGEHGKGFFWSVDEQYEHTFEEQEAKALAQSQAQFSQSHGNGRSSSQGYPPTGGKDGKCARKKDRAAPLDPPLKRSVKNGSGPLPPPLTSTPLPLLSKQPALISASSATIGTPAGFPSASPASVGTGEALVSKAEPVVPNSIGSIPPASTLTPSTTSQSTSISMRPVSTCGEVGPTSVATGTSDVSSISTSASTFTSTTATSPLSALPPSVCLPIIVGPIPSSHPSSAFSATSSSVTTDDPPPIVLHNNTLILSPLIFSSLTAEQLKALEAMGAQKALEVLQGHIVRYLKERMGRKRRRKTGNGDKKAGKGDGSGRGENVERSSPFTTVPLPPRGPQSKPQSSYQSQSSLSQRPPSPQSSVPASVESRPPVPVPISISGAGSGAERVASLFLIVNEDENGMERATKRRRIEPFADLEVSKDTDDVAAMDGEVRRAMQVAISGAVDEDVEIDVC